MSPTIEKLLQELRETKAVVETSRRIYVSPAERVARIKHLTAAIEEVTALAEQRCRVCHRGHDPSICFKCA
jgi:hypothetical protein